MYAKKTEKRTEFDQVNQNKDQATIIRFVTSFGPPFTDAIILWCDANGLFMANDFGFHEPNSSNEKFAGK